MTWLETTQGIIALISSGLVLLGTILGLSVKLYRAIKQIIDNNNWNKIIELADVAITAAEETGKSGADKKQLVIEAVEEGCRKLGITVDLDQLSNYIDKCIQFANRLNKK